MKASTQISKEDLRGQEVCGRVRISEAALERMMHKSVRVKQKMQWRP
jgi:hypothetical protein